MDLHGLVVQSVERVVLRSCARSRLVAGSGAGDCSDFEL